MKRLLVISATIGLSFVAAACGSAQDSAESSVAGSPDMSGMPGMPMSPGGHAGGGGMPGRQSEVDATIAVSQLDTLVFDPGSLDVKLGETVEFVVTNEGTVDHEFVLGNAAFQAAHENEMAGMDGSMPTDERGAVSVAPGETKSVIWRFTEPGSLLYGCHVAGHYAAGMMGDITVVG